MIATITILLLLQRIMINLLQQIMIKIRKPIKNKDNKKSYAILAVCILLIAMMMMMMTLMWNYLVRKLLLFLKNIHHQHIHHLASSNKSFHLFGIQLFCYDCGLFAKHSKIHLVFFGLTALNALMMELVPFPLWYMINLYIKFIWTNGSNHFKKISLELVLQFMFYSYHFFDDSWLVFDCIIIVNSWSFQKSSDNYSCFLYFWKLRLIKRKFFIKDVCNNFQKRKRSKQNNFYRLILFFLNECNQNKL